MKRSYDSRTIVYNNRDGGKSHSDRNDQFLTTTRSLVTTSSTSRSSNDLFNFSGTFQQIVDRGHNHKSSRNNNFNERNDDYDLDLKRSLFNQLAVFENKLRQRDSEIAFLKEENDRLRSERNNWKDKANDMSMHFDKCKIAAKEHLEHLTAVYEGFKDKNEA